jgi:hypothetical protein
MTKDKIIKGSTLKASAFLETYKVEIENGYYIVFKMHFNDGTNEKVIDLTRSLSSKQKGYIMQVMKDFE